MSAGGCVIVIAAHLTALGMRLGELMARFMGAAGRTVGSSPEAVAGVFVRVRGSERPLRAFEEMVALLWARGEWAAVRLEHLWNAFSGKEALSLFCAYPQEGFSEDAGGALSRICRAHSRIITNAGEQSTWTCTEFPALIPIPQTGRPLCQDFTRNAKG